MNRHFVLPILMGAMILLLASPAFAVSNAGAIAPGFSATASLAGEPFMFSLQDALAKGPVVVYFFPAAYTKGCDLEAHTFSVNMDKFEAAGATVIGVSADLIERLNQFSADPDYCAGRVAVASDPGGAIAAAYGLKMSPAQPGMVDVRGDMVAHGFLPRTTFVLDREGRIVARLSSKDDGLTPAQHVTRSLAIVEKLRKTNAR